MRNSIRENIFTPKTILLTGSTGVIGSAVKDYFKKFFPEISIICFFNPFSLSRLHDFLKDGHVNYVINCAAISSNDDSVNDPYETYSVNSFYVLKILEMTRRYNPNIKFLNCGSIYEESDFTPYSSSKRISRELIKTYRENYRLFCVQATLGFTEYYNRTEKFITRKISKKVAEIYHKTKNGEHFTSLELENPNDIFHFTWAEDVINGIWKILEMDKPEDFTIINRKNCTLKEFAKAAFDSVGLNHDVIFKQNYERSPTPDFKINNYEFWNPIYNYKDIAKMLVENDIKNYVPN